MVSANTPKKQKTNYASLILITGSWQCHLDWRRLGRPPSPHRRCGSIAPLNKRANFYIMTTLEIKGDWNITKGKLKQKWGALTDDDLQYAEGRQDELVGRIQKRTGETREAVEKAIKESFASLRL
jgi:uncharacterized protein YjbJ (UPF0337 family)